MIYQIYIESISNSWQFLYWIIKQIITISILIWPRLDKLFFSGSYLLIVDSWDSFANENSNAKMSIAMFGGGGEVYNQTCQNFLLRDIARQIGPSTILLDEIISI